LNSLRNECADIVFLDPPFNLGKKYGSREGKADRHSESEYEQFMQSILRESVRILSPGGALFLYHLPQWAMRFGAFLQGEMSFRHWIAVSMKNGFVRGDNLYPAHYALLYFTKGVPKTFNRPKVPAATCRSCGQFVKDYGGYKRYIESGINLSDVWEDLSPVRHARYKKRSENELPLELTNRVIQISGRKKGLLVDPFVGSGTSIISAYDAGMRYVASDRETTYCDIAEARLKEYTEERYEKSDVNMGISLNMTGGTGE
jgi:site-specific DNA-methyltransferase (adenine-specific)